MAEEIAGVDAGSNNTPAADAAVLDVLKKPKLTVKDLGNPKLVSAETPRVILGTIIGTATGTKSKVDAKGEVFMAIVGTFEGIAAKDGQRIQSGVLYLPGGFHDEILAQLSQEGVSDVVFAFEVSAHTASNPIGYSYAMRNLLPAMPDDPLARVRALMDKRLAEKQAAQAQAALPAPSPETASKGKGKAA